MHQSKSVIFATIVVLAAVPFWFFFYDAITIGARGALAGAYAIIFLTIHFAAVSVLLLFADRARLIFLPYILGMAPLVYFFGNSLIGIAAYVLLCLSALISFSRVQRELKSRITFHISILLRQGLPTLLTAFSLACAIGYYVQTAHAPERVTIRQILPKNVFTGIFQNTAPVLSKTLFPGFEENDTINSYIEKQLRLSGADIQRFSPKERERILKEARTQLFSKALGDAVSREITGTERLVDVFYEITALRSEKFLEPYRRFVPLALAVGFFLFLRTAALPYGWVIIFITMGTAALMKKSGALVYTEENAVKERLKWA